MQHTLQLEAVRAVVMQAFTEFNAAESEFYESVLIRDGFYCGRCFSCDSVRAVWFAEENVVKFYGQNGQFLDSRNVDPAKVDHNEQESWQQRAA